MSQTKISVDAEERNLFEKFTLGIVKSLEKRHGICDLKVDNRHPVEKHTVLAWEQKNSCMMSDDIKSFYFTQNGFSLTWNVKMNDTRIPVGKMCINKIENLSRLGGTNASGNDRNMPSLSDVDSILDATISNDDESRVPRFDHRSRIFELDPTDGNGKICLVFNNTKPGVAAQNCEVWLMDRALQWHHLADSFLSYYRLMLNYLGLPHWYLVFTKLGLTPQSKQWFNMYAPITLEQTPVKTGAANSPPKTEESISHLDLGKVFRGKPDKKKNVVSQGAKKKTLGVQKTFSAPQSRAGTGLALQQPKTR